MCVFLSVRSGLESNCDSVSGQVLPPCKFTGGCGAVDLIFCSELWHSFEGVGPVKIGNSFNVDAISYENRFEGITQPRTVQYSTVQYSMMQVWQWRRLNDTAFSFGN